MVVPGFTGLRAKSGHCQDRGKKGHKWGLKVSGKASGWLIMRRCYDPGRTDGYQCATVRIESMTGAVLGYMSVDPKTLSDRVFKAELFTLLARSIPMKRAPRRKKS